MYLWEIQYECLRLRWGDEEMGVSRKGERETDYFCSSEGTALIAMRIK